MRNCFTRYRQRNICLAWAVSRAIQLTQGKSIRKPGLVVLAFCAVLGMGILCPAWAQSINPYSQRPNAPITFAMAIAGEDTGNGISVFTTDNRVLVPTNSQSQLITGSAASADIPLYTTTPGNTAIARSSATFGTIHLFDQSTDGVNSGFANRAGAISDAGWLDRLTISDPLLDGQAGVLTFGMHVEGTLHAGSPRGAAAMELGVSAQTTSALFYRTWSGAVDHFPDFDKTVSETVTFSVPFTFGDPFLLMVRGLARTGLASRPPPAGSNGLADFEHTLFWSGVQGITNGGNPVTDYVLTSASGTNYNQSLAPVTTPEPGTLTLLLGTVSAILARGTVGRRIRRSVQG